MHEYEIRILSGQHTTAIVEEGHLNDHGAVRSARKLAAGKAFEVWRGLDCIYKAADPAATQPWAWRSGERLGREIF